GRATAQTGTCSARLVARPPRGLRVGGRSAPGACPFDEDRARCCRLRVSTAPPQAQTCATCRQPVDDVRATVYTAAGDLVCLECGTRADEIAAGERVVARRRGVIVSSVAMCCAVLAFGIFAFVYHDKRSVYVENGHVLETSDASWSVLQAGLSLALLAAFVG